MRTTPQTPEVIRIDEETDSTISDAEETTFIPCSDSRDSDQDDEHLCPYFEDSLMGMPVRCAGYLSSFKFLLKNK
jgi:hypothetical protein